MDKELITELSKLVFLTQSLKENQPMTGTLLKKYENIQDTIQNIVLDSTYSRHDVFEVAETIENYECIIDTLKDLITIDDE